MLHFAINAQALKAVSQAAKKGDNRFDYVCIRPNNASCTDTYCLLQYEYDLIEGIPESGLIFKADLFKSIKSSQKFVFFEENEDGSFIIDGNTIARPAELTFPNCSKLVKEAFEKDGSINKICFDSSLLLKFMKGFEIYEKSGHVGFNFSSMLYGVAASSSDGKLKGVIMPVKM